MALEVRACGLAAQNGDNREKDELKTIVGHMEADYDDLHKWYADDFQFHKKLALMTHNPLFPAFLEPLIQATSLAGRRGLHTAFAQGPAGWRGAAQAHTRRGGKGRPRLGRKAMAAICRPIWTISQTETERREQCI
jgi:DNA-binding FadR family transcriptional regulator